MNYSPKKMQEKMTENGFSFKKKFGQNFIIDENIINGIISRSGIDENTLVIEIGPGAGSLTNGIAAKAKNVLCYEIDDTLKTILDENLKEYSNVDIIYNDFLKSNIQENIKKYEYKEIFVVANLPYYITTPIISKIIDDKIDVSKIVIMVQKEVGDRFKAKPGTKEYGSLSVYLNYYFEINKIMDISRNVFMPKPNVDSIVIEFKKRKDKIKVNNEEQFFKLIKDSFVQKRKTIRNNLRNYDLNKIEYILKQNGFDLSTRAEQVSIEIFAEISNNL
ncbi:MAG: 16S rRNA (adenine(1518)-N(6)/adenine(1519)-N(6))-dimethyltransferase RsmA [Bacilli bacterium]